MSETKPKIFLKDAQGRVLQVQSLKESKDFELENLQEGIYYVELLLPHGKAITHQFSVNH